MHKIAVVILNWNGEKFLKQFLPSLTRHTNVPGAVLVVADNASTDNSLNFVTSAYPAIEIIKLDRNYGFAGGYNRALAQIDAEYFVLLNSDVEVTEGWLEPMIAFMDANPNMAACQPKIRAYNNKPFFEHAGAAGGVIDYLGYPYCRGRVFSDVEEDKGQYDTISEIFWASGACMFVRSELYAKVGGLDDDFFAHMEEIDLCWRLNARGYKIACVPQSVVYHVGGGTLHTEHPRKTYLNYRNNLLMLYKNLPQKALKKVLRIRKVLDYVAFLQLFLTGKRQNALSILEARRDFKNLLPQFLEKRNENLLYATQVDCNGMLPESIIFQYFIARKKRYTDIHKEKK